MSDDIAEMREEYIRLLEKENEELRNEIYKVQLQAEKKINTILQEVNRIKSGKKKIDKTIPFEMMSHKEPKIKTGNYEKVSICHLCGAVSQWHHNPFITNFCSYCGGEPDVVITKPAKWCCETIDVEKTYAKRKYWLFGKKKQYTKAVKEKKWKWVFADETESGGS